MKLNKKIRTAAFVTAAAFICSSTGYYAYTVFDNKRTVPTDKAGIVREISAEVAPAGFDDTCVEKLANACEQNTAMRYSAKWMTQGLIYFPFPMM